LFSKIRDSALEKLIDNRSRIADFKIIIEVGFNRFFSKPNSIDVNFYPFPVSWIGQPGVDMFGGGVVDPCEHQKRLLFIAKSVFKSGTH
jgi:hypothetical protein